MAKVVTDEKLLALLIEHGSVTKVASVIGVTRNALYKRLQNDDFRQRYEEAKSAVLTDACDAIAVKLEDAASVLHSVAMNDRASDGIRVSAASALLREGLRYIEVANVLKRLDALEKAQSEVN